MLTQTHTKFVVKHRNFTLQEPHFIPKKENFLPTLFTPTVQSAYQQTA